MSGFLIDTNVISEFIKPQPDSQVIRWLEAADPESLFASVITFGEIRLGIEDLAPENAARIWSSGLTRVCRNGSKTTCCLSPKQSSIGGEG